MTRTTHPIDVRHRHVAHNPLVLLGLILSLVVGVLVSDVTDAGALAATSVTVERHGTRLGTTVILDSSARISITIGTSRLPDGKADYSGAGLSNLIASSAVSPSSTTAWYHLNTGLKPGTLYWVQVYAKQGNGSWTQVVRNRAETTKNRVVRVYWDKVRISDDGDPMGCGEITLRAEVDHRWGQQDHVTSSEFSGCDFQNVTMNWVSPFVTVNGASLSIQGAAQDDDSPSNVLCTAGWGGCGDFSQGSETLALPNENNDGYMKPFEFSLQNRPFITWYGRYWVGYA